MSLEKLAKISRFYGSNPEFVVAGGGNTSFKDKDFLYVKASGTSLAQAKPADFVKMNRPALAAIWEKNYPTDTDAREAAVLADMMASRCPGEESKRPSVETLLHDLLPFAYVVHLHPSLVNGLSCSVEGEAAAKRLFPEALWIPLINPGYILSKAVKDALNSKNKSGEVQLTGSNSVILLQNHGIFVAANTVEEIHEIYNKVMGTLDNCIKKKPDFGGATANYGDSESLEKEILNIAQKIDSNSKWFIKFERSNQIATFVADESAFKSVSSAFTPDHIVYSGSDPLFVKDRSDLEQAFKLHVEKTGRTPKIIAIQSLGVFGLANSEKAVENSLELFRDTQKVAVYTESFGGQRFMTRDIIDFINNWEIERYRSQVGVRDGRAV
ncbi:MAG: class II aldolase/adducin family protein [Treponema sp.]|jgi:rhamnose utilization protein RhaD (predicted bifunctional aldolase and dehydrogenase)|nr:class II aldolase/adducin family protein [Treponema sp.]